MFICRLYEISREKNEQRMQHNNNNNNNAQLERALSVLVLDTARFVTRKTHSPFYCDRPEDWNTRKIADCGWSCKCPTRFS